MQYTRPNGEKITTDESEVIKGNTAYCPYTDNLIDSVRYMDRDTIWSDSVTYYQNNRAPLIFLNVTEVKTKEGVNKLLLKKEFEDSNIYLETLAYVDNSTSTIMYKCIINSFKNNKFKEEHSIEGLEFRILAFAMGEAWVFNNLTLI